MLMYYLKGGDGFVAKDNFHPFLTQQELKQRNEGNCANELFWMWVKPWFGFALDLVGVYLVAANINSLI